jgi:hypothetical protein
MFAKFKKAVEGAAQRLDVAVASGTANIRRASQPAVSSAAQAPKQQIAFDDRIHSSNAAGDLILHYQTQWRAIHAATVAQESERARVDNTLQRVVRDCLRRAATIDSLRKSIHNISHDLPPTLVTLQQDVATLATRLATLATTIETAEKEQTIRNAFEKASQHEIENFEREGGSQTKKLSPAIAPDAAAVALSDVVIDHDQNDLENFLGPSATVAAEAAEATEAPEAAEVDAEADDYFGDS